MARKRRRKSKSEQRRQQALRAAAAATEFAPETVEEALLSLEEQLSERLRLRLTTETIRVDYLSNGQRVNINNPQKACRISFFRNLRYHPERFFSELWEKSPRKLCQKAAREIVRTTYPEYADKSNRAIQNLPEYSAALALAGKLGVPERITQDLKKKFSFEDMLVLLAQNRRYKKLVDDVYAWMENDRRIREAVLAGIPADPVELYSAARSMDRHFILHIGPTNSGKTKEALEALALSGDGVYLAPLRLMAYEAHETINRSGIPCSMMTGEELIEIPGNNLWAMTIEMLDITQDYETAVIDEAQMCTDRDRGGAWTRAILGTAAKEIHVCAAPNVENLLIRMIESCEDTFEIRRHERLTALEHDEEKFYFPESVQEGDALIVFTAKSARYYAGELERHHIPCSLIYGKLPYEARHSEAARFSSGETKVLVATDAIGMGLNLPIRRIVFLETEKFDGRRSRLLEYWEVKQIAGRAGRYGRYPKGYYLAAVPDNAWIEEKFVHPDGEWNTAVIGFPDELKRIEARPSEVISRWISLPALDGYVKSDLEEMAALAKHFEKETDDRDLIYFFACLPANVAYKTDMFVLDRAFQLVQEVGMLSAADFDFLGEPNPADTEWHLRDLCTQFDLAARCLKHFGTWEDVETLQDRRKDAAYLVAEKVKFKKPEDMQSRPDQKGGV